MEVVPALGRVHARRARDGLRVRGARARSPLESESVRDTDPAWKAVGTTSLRFESAALRRKVQLSGGQLVLNARGTQASGVRLLNLPWMVNPYGIRGLSRKQCGREASEVRVLRYPLVWKAQRHTRPFDRLRTFAWSSSVVGVCHAHRGPCSAGRRQRPTRDCGFESRQNPPRVL